MGAGSAMAGACPRGTDHAMVDHAQAAMHLSTLVCHEGARQCTDEGRQRNCHPISLNAAAMRKPALCDAQSRPIALTRNGPGGLHMAACCLELGL